jgi:hypothetical protein
MAFACCPRCGESLQPAEAAETLLGYQLLDIHDVEAPVPTALEASAPVPPEVTG